MFILIIIIIIIITIIVVIYFYVGKRPFIYLVGVIVNIYIRMYNLL
jgi:hypothetical protein